MSRVVVLGALVLAGCGSRPTEPRPAAVPAREPAPPSGAVVDAGPDAGSTVPRLAPGSWPHVRWIHACAVAIEAAPPSEVMAQRDAAHARIAPLGGTARVDLTPRGDRVTRIEWVGAARPAKAPRTAEEARTLSLAFLDAHIDLFGISRDELATVRFVERRAGAQWQIFGSLLRTPRLDVQPVRIGFGVISVTLDRAGRLVAASVDADLPPPVTLCDVAFDDEKIAAIAVGHVIEWSMNSGVGSAPPIARADIVRIQRTAQVLRLERQPALLEVGVVYVLRVLQGRRKYYAVIDPVTATVIESGQVFLEPDN